MATTEKYDSKRLRTEFVSPLLALAAAFQLECDEMEKAIASGQMPRDYLPIVGKGGLDALKKLQDFLDVVKGKRSKAERGTLKYREKELEKMRESYTQKKVQTKTQKKKI